MRARTTSSGLFSISDVTRAIFCVDSVVCIVDRGTSTHDRACTTPASVTAYIARCPRHRWIRPRVRMTSSRDDLASASEHVVSATHRPCCSLRCTHRNETHGQSCRTRAKSTGVRARCSIYVARCSLHVLRALEDHPVVRSAIPICNGRRGVGTIHRVDSRDVCLASWPSRLGLDFLFR
jgi:hypothetical protein